MRRSTCGIAFGFGGSLLLASSVYAWAVAPSPWTLLAIGISGAFNIVLLSGFGRALYDVFIHNWSPREEE